MGIKHSVLFRVFLVVAITLPGCSSREKEQEDFILTEKDIIPEGVAFDPGTQTIYISSTHKRKIVSIGKDGVISDFIREGQDDIKSVIGMEVESRTNSLWAISSEANDVLPLKGPGPGQWRSSVYQFNLVDGRLIKRYALNKDSVFLNDITVGADGTVYATETMRPAIYKIAPGEDSLQLLVQLKPYTFMNGICFAADKGRLFATSTEGILAVDLATKEYRLLASATTVDYKDIDGLAFSGDHFIGHQSTKVCRFRVNKAMDSIIASDTLNNGKEFDGSTTGETGNGYYYFIVNSQIQSGIDYKKKQIKPLDSLENIIIRKIKLNK